MLPPVKEFYVQMHKHITIIFAFKILSIETDSTENGILL